MNVKEITGFCVAIDNRKINFGKISLAFKTIIVWLIVDMVSYDWFPKFTN